ncbi:MAG: FHIPEP family type III secretion protein, partial [Allorhizobium sp.]
VSKAGVSGAADKALSRQLSGYPQAMGLASVVLAILSVLPGIPMLPFLGLAIGVGYLAFSIAKAQGLARTKAAAEKVTAEAKAPPAEEPIQTALKMDDLKIELGYGLLPLVNAPDGTDRLTDQIKALRRSLASEMGFVMPSVRILDNVQLDANAYVIKLKETDAGTGLVWANQYMVMDPSGGQVKLPGHHTVEPTFGLPATWIESSLRDEAAMRGYTVVDATTVLSTHLTEILKGNMADLLSYAEVQKLLKDLPKEQSDLVKDIVPSQISITGIQRVLQALLAERVSIRDLGTILEGIAEATGFTRNPRDIAEHVRSRLARQLCAQNAAANGVLPILALSPRWETAFAEAITGQGDERHLAMQPSKLTEFVHAVRDAFEDAARAGEMPVLLTSTSIRPFVRNIV